MPMTRVAACLLAVVTIAAAEPAPVQYSDYASAFDAFEERTQGMPQEERIAQFRKEFDRLRPGLYPNSNPQHLDRKIARSLDEFPALRPSYRSVVQRFGPALSEAVHRFRQVFPDFSPPLPIILAHELGVRDGGSDFVGGTKVMLFGADVIAKLHNDDSLQPFLEHELFHLEHARHFADCGQFWCLLWQEGLATYAASQMTPGASDHQLLLDQPVPLREGTERHWKEALCIARSKFDAKDETAIAEAFTGGESSSSALPRRFGYYLGYKVAQQAARRHGLPELARLDNEHARPVVERALEELLSDSGAACPPSSQSAGGDGAEPQPSPPTT
ncbi:MAG TPA: DUF2268 domain-containing putative Zn-dependent protease [Sphingomicrobium sp.]|nr:DUF2268 domain-containing putative Zn-dependent protease [Sphingomicrobium sp.]